RARRAEGDEEHEARGHGGRGLLLLRDPQEPGERLAGPRAHQALQRATRLLHLRRLRGRDGGGGGGAEGGRDRHREADRRDGGARVPDPQGADDLPQGGPPGPAGDVRVQDGREARRGLAGADPDPRAVAAGDGARDHQQALTAMPRVAVGSVSLAVAEWPGPAKGEAVVCIHALTANHTCWASVADVLSPAHRLIAYDLRGRGESDKPDRGYSLATHGDDLEGLLVHFGLKKAVLIGHSLGAHIAVRFTATRPERVAKLVLVDGGLDVRHEIVESLRPAINRLGVEFPSLDMFMGFVRALPMFEGRWNDYLERYFRYDVEELPAGTVRAKAARLAIEEEIA